MGHGRQINKHSIRLAGHKDFTPCTTIEERSAKIMITNNKDQKSGDIKVGSETPHFFKVVQVQSYKFINYLITFDENTFPSRTILTM